MVTVRDYKIAVNSKDGEKFCMLILEGEVEMVQSKKTGKFYATVRKCSVPATFDEATCKAMIGKIMPGGITRVPCTPYEYTIPSTGEVVTLDYTYSYNPQMTEVEAVVANELVS